jgi:tRNA nucleotidyltransferase/poly(A) polymerase
LRILRLARIAARYGLTVEPATLRAASEGLPALRGVSPERVQAELERMASGPDPGRAFGMLAELGALERAVPSLGALAPADLAARVRALPRLGPAAGIRRVLALLLRPDRSEGVEPAQEALRALRVPRATVEAVGRVWQLELELERCLAELASGAGRRSRLIRLVRAEEYADARACWSAAHPERAARELPALDRFAASLAEHERFPRLFVASADLARAGVPRGPRWSTLLREAEERQLDQEFRSRDEALAWLARRSVELEEARGADGGEADRTA